jgi:hypothetical protein
MVAFASPSDVITDSVDIIEVNHYYDDRGVLILDQVIFWDWCDRSCEFHVVAWRLLRSPNQVPHRDWQHGGFVALWYDEETLREVRAKWVRHTWTQYDPEVQDRYCVPKHERRGLTNKCQGTASVVETTTR